MPGARDEKSLAATLEEIKVVRNRFRKDVSFLQWPIPPHSDEGNGDEEPEDRYHPICTKSLELNHEILIATLHHYGGQFCDVKDLEREAWDGDTFHASQVFP